jgi:hypothetical protein
VLPHNGSCIPLPFLVPPQPQVLQRLPVARVSLPTRLYLHSCHSFLPPSRMLRVMNSLIALAGAACADPRQVPFAASTAKGPMHPRFSAMQPIIQRQSGSEHRWLRLPTSHPLLHPIRGGTPFPTSHPTAPSLLSPPSCVCVRKAIFSRRQTGAWAWGGGPVPKPMRHRSPSIQARAESLSCSSLGPRAGKVDASSLRVAGVRVLSYSAPARPPLGSGARCSKSCAPLIVNASAGAH